MADKPLAVRDSAFVRLLRALRLVEVDSDGMTNHDAGADWASDVAATEQYSHLNSLASMSRFPFVYAAVNAISQDLSRIPIRLRKGRGANAEPVENHPFLDLIDEPSTRTPKVLFLRQLITDLVLSGDAYVLIAGKSQPEALLRMHPSRVRVVPSPDGQVDSFEYSAGAPIRYEYDQVAWISTPSWSDDPRGLYGVGAIQSLHSDLMTEKATAELTALTSATGRPTGILAPSEEGDRWSKSQIDMVKDAYTESMSKGSAVLVVGGAVDYTPISWSPRDMEFTEVRKLTRESILAALDVPPARVGLPNTNYATAAAQSKRYFESLIGRADLFAAEFTRIARQFPNSDDLYVYFDFSDVEALQESKTERVGRVLSWNMLGLSPAEAAALEGFDEYPNEPEPVQNVDEPEIDAIDETPDAGTDEPLAATALNGAQVASLISILGQVSIGALSSDAAVALIGAAFPTVSDDQARRIVEGANPVADPDAEPEPETEIELSEDDDDDESRFFFRAYETIDFDLPDGVIDELERGLEWYEEGKAGDGLTEATVRAARRMVSEGEATPEKVRLMVPWFARHESDKTGEGFKPGEDGYPSAGRVAWSLWGGDAGQTWSNKVLDQMTREDSERDEGDGESKTGGEWIAETKDDEGFAVWRAIMDDIHGPQERALARAVRVHLRGHAARIAARLEDALEGEYEAKGGALAKVTRANLGDEWLADLLDMATEKIALIRATVPIFTATIRKAFARALEDLGPAAGDVVEITDSAVDRLARRTARNMADDMEKLTFDRVGKLVNDMIDEGATIGQMQAALMGPDFAFSPQRALRVARTETTKSMTAGQRAGYEAAAKRGIDLEIEWFSQPGARDSHKRGKGLGGQRVKPTEPFVVPSGVKGAGQTGMHPGDFDSAHLNVNCRCTLTAKVK